MAITNQIYDIGRDQYIELREMQLNRMKMEEEEFHRQQQQQSMYGQAIFGQASRSQMVQAKNQATSDPKDPLAFLNKSDNKLLLTGEAL